MGTGKNAQNVTEKVLVDTAGLRWPHAWQRRRIKPRSNTPQTQRSLYDNDVFSRIIVINTHDSLSVLLMFGCVPLVLRPCPLSSGANGSIVSPRDSRQVLRDLS